MKNLINRSTKGMWKLFSVIIIFGMCITTTRAQEVIISEYKDIIVSGDHEKIYIALQGGDGGKNDLADGGRGATVTGVLNIGTDPGMIFPGSTLRFIPGAAGENASDGGGGGGGASALVYKAPGSSQWNIIAVAAGGGGASLKDSWNSTGHNGGEGKTGTGNMESNPSFLGNKGGGAFIGSNNKCSGQAGMVNNQPTQASVGSDCKAKGGKGFGSGASAYDYGNNHNLYYGGGGGGYYGGYISGDGETNSYDNGGGSWAYKTFLPTAKAYANGTTRSPQDGYAMYSFDLQIKFAYNNSKCLDDDQAGTSDGTNIQSWDCSGSDAQKWWINTWDRTIRFDLDLNKCIDVSHAKTDNGTNIQLWHCNGTNAQKWVYNGLFKTLHSGLNAEKCLDANNGSTTANNVNVWLWDCNYSGNNQKWEIEGATTVNDPVHAKFIVPVLDPGYAVHSHTANEQGSNIQLWTNDPFNYALYWYFDGLTIKMREFRDLCIDLSQGSTSNGNNIQLWNCNGTNAQKWIYDGMTKSIRSVINPDKCMQIEKNSDGVYGKRSNIDIQDCDGSVAQQFLIQG